MSQRKPRPSLVPSKTNMGGMIIDYTPQPGDPAPGRPPLALAPGDDERTRADKTARIAAMVVELMMELVPDRHRPAVEEAAREFVERIAHTAQPATTCQADTSKNSTATPSVDGTAP